MGEHVAGGTNRTIFNNPWHVGIYQTVNGSPVYICGGTLISKSVIVTAAHCLIKQDDSTKELRILNPNSFRIGLGKTYREYDDSRDTSAQFRNVSSQFK